MMKSWKKWMASVCTAFMLITMPGMGVLADEMQEEFIAANAELPEKADEFADFQDEEAADELDAIIDEETISQSATEEVVGEGAVQVGDGVTATFDPDTGSVKFYSDGGTLAGDWVDKLGLNKTDIRYINVVSGTVYLPADSSKIFSCHNLITFDGSGFDTSRVTNMHGMFYDCAVLQNLDVSGFNTSNVTDMGSMFYSCHILSELHLENFNTSNVTDMSLMFSGCLRISELDLKSFNTSEVTNMAQMFSDCRSLYLLDMSSFNTSKVTTMMGMFWACSGLTELDVSNFKTSNVTDMCRMFSGCSSLTDLDVYALDTSNVTDMEYMFANSYRLSYLNVGNFNTSKLTFAAYMFDGCSGLEILDGISFVDIQNAHRIHDMFRNCSSLKVLDLSGFNITKNMEAERLLDGCSNISILLTPRVENTASVVLPNTMYDSAGNEYSSLSGISESIVLSSTKALAEEYEVDPNYFSKIRKENNGYDNSDKDFFSEGEKLGYYTSYNKQLEKGIEAEGTLGPIDYLIGKYRIFDEINNKGWDGACFGIAVSMVLDRLGVENISGDSTYFDLGKPCDNHKFRDVIHYYQLLQKVDCFESCEVCKCFSDAVPYLFDNDKNYLQLFLKRLVLEAKRSQIERKPFVFTYYFKRTSRAAGHSVVVCGFEQYDYDHDNALEYKIKTFDPNNQTYMMMYVEPDYSSFLYRDSCGTQERDDPEANLQNVWTSMNYVGIDDLETDWYYKLGLGKEGVTGGNEDVVGASETPESEYSTIIIDADEPFIIENNEGKKLGYDGSYYGDMEIYSVHYTGNHSPMLKIQTRPSDSFTVTGMEEDLWISVEIEGHYLRAFTSGADEIIIDKETGITLDGNESYSFSAAIGTSIEDGTLMEISAETSGEVIIASQEENVTVESESEMHNAVVAAINEDGRVEREVEGDKQYIDIAEEMIKETPVSIANATISGVNDSYPHTGMAITPDITVTVDGHTLIDGTDYSIEYINNVNVGTATAKIKGKGKYEGEVSVTFAIVKEATVGFSDVQDPTHPYYNAIYWAAEKKITGGYKDGTFGINKPCTRGHAVMFLWKMEGAPDPKNAAKSPFSDVPKGHPYYKAVLWAQQKGITKGYTSGPNKGKFGIDDTCTRGQIMMFIWNYKAKPATNVASKSPFSDVPTTHPYYKAILWGSKNGVTKGYTTGPNAGKFGINDNCTRGQIVKFLYNIR